MFTRVTSRWHGCHPASRIAAILMLGVVVLNAVGLGTDYWTDTNLFYPEDSSLFNVHSGLWKHCYCNRDLFGQCFCEAISNAHIENKLWFRATQVVVTSGFVVTSLGALLGLASVTVTANPTVRLAEILLTTLGGFSSVTGVAIIWLNTLYQISWSAVLCVVAGAMPFILQLPYAYGFWTRLDGAVVRARTKMDGPRVTALMDKRRLKQAMRLEGFFET